MLGQKTQQSEVAGSSTARNATAGNQPLATVAGGGNSGNLKATEQDALTSNSGTGGPDASSSGTMVTGSGNVPTVGTEASRTSILPLVNPRSKDTPENPAEAEAAKQREVETRRAKVLFGSLAAGAGKRNKKVQSGQLAEGSQTRISSRSGSKAFRRRGPAGSERVGATSTTRTGNETARDYASSSNSSTTSTEKRRGRAAKQAKLTYEPLALRPVIVSELEVEEPEVNKKRRPRTKRTRINRTLQKMGVELVAGTGVSYRKMGGITTQLQSLEKPGVSYSGHLGVTYALNKRLSVMAGAGYAEFATSLNYQLKKTAQDAATKVSFRDVHRYFSVPVQMQYQILGNHRWNIGTMGGATVSLRSSSRTTEGNACACTQRDWEPGVASPYRATNLLLTAGAFANYQMAVGQWFTLRPQAQYFLNSITDPAQNQAARHPWNLGVEVGVMWDLAPRKK
ncbi:hypothetical protein [Hymenobacter sp. BT730]|uniref:hypothetical protein n=1 Tax=Hymenobacter sp. BT730 TaxID=3063332 RepID=UPI0026E06526|nr:hypothetical protein [Hymenobacter sp. BT730]